MNTPAAAGPAEVLLWLGQNWARAMAEVIEGLSAQKAEAVWMATEPVVDPAAQQAVLGWRQPFDLADDGALAWAAAAEPSWRALGSHVLAAAGVESPGQDEVRGTAVEVLGQAFARLAQSMGERLGHPVVSLAGSEGAAPPEALKAGSAQVRLSDAATASISVFCSPLLARLLAAPAPARTAAEAQAAGGAEQDPPPSATLDLLRDMELPVSVSFGKTQLPLNEILKLAAGSVIELDRAVSDPVALVVNNTVVALGEVVVIEGNYGLRVSEIMSREKLLRSSGLT
jgi:flagellar motor switch protein FliN/FliY